MKKNDFLVLQWKIYFKISCNFSLVSPQNCWIENNSYWKYTQQSLVYYNSIIFLTKKRKTHENANYLFSVIPWSRCLIVLNWHCHLVSKIIPKCLLLTRPSFQNLRKHCLMSGAFLQWKKFIIVVILWWTLLPI